MQCERCGDESHWVKETLRQRTADGRVSPTVDRRLYICKACGLHTIVECRAMYVEVYDPETMTKKNVTLDEYREVWRKRDEITSNQLKLFGGNDA